MMKLRWAILFTALTVFLTACPPTDTPGELGVSLTAAPTSLPVGGGSVKLTAAVTNGPADQVEFFQGTTSINVDATEPYEFDVTGVTATSTFKAVASKGGVNASSADVTVTVGTTQPGTAVAVNKTINTVVTLPTVSGLTGAAGQAVAGAVTGIVGTVKAETKTTSRGNVVIATAPANTLRFTYTPTAANTAAGTDTFTYSVTQGSDTKTGTITLNLAPFVESTTLAGINDAPENAVVLLTGTGIIPCTTDPCITMKAGQSLVGTGAAAVRGVDGVTITNAAAKRTIRADAATKVIVVAANTTVQGVAITNGVGDFIFRAIRGGVATDPALTGTITLKDIDITMGTSTGNAIQLGTEVPADRDNTLLFDDIVITGLGERKTGIAINSAKKVDILKSSITYDAGNAAGVPTVPPAPPTATVAAVSITGTTTEITLDDVTVVSAAPDSDADASNAPLDPAFNIFKLNSATEMKLTVKNTKSTVGAAAPPVGPGTAFFLTGVGTGKINIQAGSTGNTITPATATKVVTSGAGAGGTGTIGF